MMQEFFGKPFRIALLSLVGLLAFSAVGYFFYLEPILLIVLALVTGIASYKKLEWGLVIVFLELMSNAHGQLFFHSVGSFVISARMVIFLALFIGWGISILSKRSVVRWKDERVQLFLPLILAIACGFLVGMIRRSPLDVFRDGNAYLYLFYLLPILHVDWDTIKQRVVLQFLAAGTIFTSIISIIILYAYTHFSEPFLKAVYVFLRDIRFAEITRLQFGMYRIFEQTQLFVFIFGLILIPRLFFPQSKKDRLLTMAILSLVFTAALIGMSRSFWLGLIVAGLVILFSFIFLKRPGFKDAFLGSLRICLCVFIAGLLLVGTVLFPWPHDRSSGDALTSIFGSRLSESDVAVSSRWNLLQPMLETIKDSPIVGNGFGQTVTFKTDDPRVRAIHPDGSWTTTSMEWGWFELWLKMGIFALIGFAVLFVLFVRRISILFSTPKMWLGIWVISSLVFLYVTHMFSPYLNHPIGIGTILMLFIFLPPDLRIRPFAFGHLFKQKMSQPMFATSSVQTIKTKSDLL